jgi:hypothetical protein
LSDTAQEYLRGVAFLLEAGARHQCLHGAQIGNAGADELLALSPR